MGRETNAGQGGYIIHGNIETGAFGAGASANVGAIGEHSRGYITIGSDPAAQRRLMELLNALEELVEAVERHRETIDAELYDTVESNLEDLQASIEESKPAKKIQSKLKTLQMLLAPFDTLVSLVTKILELVQKSEA
ncbi:hypothetical protein [Glycomyces tenuis]|uniref:hypothetical protein n=1 Tax=Glycomyces tenuis TaxID=58116 RepID=UPI0012DF6D6B|nr:hypothetical protein [Glycomyces tenuis]